MVDLRRWINKVKFAAGQIFINAAVPLLLLLSVSIIVTPLVITRTTTLWIGQSAVFVSGVAMGDSPTGINAILEDSNIATDINTWLFAWLWIIRFMGWLVIPTIVALMVDRINKNVEQQQEVIRIKKQELIKREDQLLRDIDEKVHQSVERYMADLDEVDQNKLASSTIQLVNNTPQDSKTLFAKIISKFRTRKFL